MGLKFSKRIMCPNCFKLLSKATELQGKPVLHVKHRGYEAYATELVVLCVSCDTFYLITPQGVIREMDING